MSADSPRRSSASRGLAVPATVPPQVVSDRSILDSAIGFINDVTLVHQPITDPKDTITWARFETSADVSDPRFGDDWELEGNAAPPLLLILGYGLGVQVWAIPANGEAVEVLSWRHGVVSALRILPTPTCASALDDNGRADERIDAFAEKRPLIALVDGGTGGGGGGPSGIGGSLGSSPQFCAVNFVSLKTGGQVKTIKFKNPVLDIQANRSAVAITFHERIAIFDARTLEDRLTVISCYPSPGINPNPIALGPRWLAYAEHKVLHTKRSGGGCDGEGVPSYTATVLNAAKSFGKGLRELGEQMAAGLTGTTASTGSSKSSSFDSSMGAEAKQPGVVTIIDTKYPIKDYSPTSGTPTNMHAAGTDPIVAHFVAHTEAIVAMEFDSSGMLLLTADRRGHDFHVFRVQPHPVGSSLAAVHHLYVLHRGDTSAKVQNIAFSLDSRWVAVSTLRGTTHVFPITPYGGAMGVRTHTSLHVVNKLSRFHRSAGLSAEGRSNSPISHSESTTFMQSLQPYHNPTLPPFPRPTVVQPLTQLRQPFALGSPPGSAGLAAVSGKLGSVGGSVGTVVGVSQQRQRLSSLSDDSGKPLSVCAMFAKSRSWLLDPPNATREAPHRIQRKAVDSLFVMAGHGALIQYDLDTKLASNVAKEKICDDTPIELEVEAKAQWNLGRRKDGSQEIVPPLALDNWLIKDRHACMLLDSAHNFDDADDRTESWLSQVEIITHAGPHRRLWMGPQFVFKTYNTPSGSNLNHVDTEAVEIGTAKSASGAAGGPSSAVTVVGGTAVHASAMSAGSCARNERSSPLNMPLTAAGRAAGVPVLIESGSYSSIEQSPKLMDRFRHGHLDSDFGHGDIRLKEDLADAMRESPSASAARRETGRLLLSSESSAHAVSAAAVAATTSNAASSENAYFYDALTEHDDANENEDDDDDNDDDEVDDDDDGGGDDADDDEHNYDNDDDNVESNVSGKYKRQTAAGNNNSRTNSRRHANESKNVDNLTVAASVSASVADARSKVVVVMEKNTKLSARTREANDLKSTANTVSASAAALASALPNIYSYDHHSGISGGGAKYTNKNNRTKIEKIVNPLGTVTTITAGLTSDAQTDVLDEVVGQLAAEDCIIHENCDEALFRPVVAIFCDGRDEAQRAAEELKQLAEHCKPPVVITNKLIVPVIAKEVDDVLTQKEKQQKSNVKSKQQRQKQLQLQQAERKQAEQQQQQRFEELSNLSKRCKDNSSSKTKVEVSATQAALVSHRQSVATPAEQTKSTETGPKAAATQNSEDKSKAKENEKVSAAVIKPSIAKGGDAYEEAIKKKEQKTAQKVATKTATVAAKIAAAETRKTSPISKSEMKTVAITETAISMAQAPALAASTKATAKSSKTQTSDKERCANEKTEKTLKTSTYETRPERVTQIKANVLDAANLADSLMEVHNNDFDDDDDDDVDGENKTLNATKTNAGKSSSSLKSELKGEELSTNIKGYEDSWIEQDDDSILEDLADSLLEQKTQIAQTMMSSASAKGLKLQIVTREEEDGKTTQIEEVKHQPESLSDKAKKINMDIEAVDEKKKSKENAKKVTAPDTNQKLRSDQKLKKETQCEKGDVKTLQSGGAAVTASNVDDAMTIGKATKCKVETEIIAAKPTAPKKQAGKVASEQQEKKLATPSVKSAAAAAGAAVAPILSTGTTSKKATPGFNESLKTYTVKVIEERPSSTDSSNSTNSSGNESGKALRLASSSNNEKLPSPYANKKPNKSKPTETNNTAKGKAEPASNQSRMPAPALPSAWKNLSGAEILSRNVDSTASTTSTDTSDYPSLASSLSPAKKSTKPSTLPEVKSEISEKLLPALPTPMKPAMFAPGTLTGTPVFKDPLSNTQRSASTTLGGKKSKNSGVASAGLDHFLVLKPLESLPPLPALQPFEDLAESIEESDANGKSATTIAEQMSLINFESPLQENPALQRKITPNPRGFSEQNLIFALCGSLHYENEFAKSLDESAAKSSFLKQTMLPHPSSKSTSSSNNSSGSEEIVVVEEPKKLSKKHKRSKQQLEQLQKQRNEQTLLSAATAADDDDELRPLISMSDSQLDSYAETTYAGEQLAAADQPDEELLHFSDLSHKKSLRKSNAANASPLAQSASTTTDSEGPIPATTSEDNLYLPVVTSATTPHKLKTKKLEHKINLIAAIEAATSSSTSSAEESGVESGGPSGGGTVLGESIGSAAAAAGSACALNGLAGDALSKGSNTGSGIGGTLPLSGVMSSSSGGGGSGIATTTTGGVGGGGVGVGAVVNATGVTQQSVAKKKTKRRKR